MITNSETSSSRDILVITREYPPFVLGGLSYHLKELYNRISARGNSVTVVAGVCRESTKSELEIDSDIRVERVNFRTRRGHHVLFTAAALRRIKKLEIERFDIAITHTPFPSNVGLPMIGKYHDCAPVEREHTPNRGPLLKVMDTLIDPTRDIVNQQSFNVVDHAIFNSNLCRTAWSDHYDLPQSTDVRYNGVNTDTFYPRETPDDSYLLFVGNSMRKGLDRVLEYAPTATYPIYTVGPSILERENIEALGRVSQERLAELYSGAIATIHPARFEAFGNIVLESLACGTPVVTTNQCGAAEILDKSCGAVTTDLHQGIRAVEGLKAEDCLSIAKEYTWGRVVTQMLELVDRYSAN